MVRDYILKLDIKTIQDYVRNDIFNTSLGATKSNVGGWQSFRMVSWPKELKELQTFVEKQIPEYTFQTLWFNSNGYGHYNLMHNHHSQEIDAVSGGTRYKGFVDNSLPGGDNYREIVYTWKNAPVEHDVQDHFNELSQISHALVRDRKLADGSISLHVDELQSDLHTQGKQYGYSTPELDMDDTIILGKMSSGISTEFTKLKNRILPILENSNLDRGRLENIKTQIANAEELYARSPQDRFSLIRMNDARREIFDTWSSLSESAGGFLMAEDIALFKPFDNVIRPALEIAQAKSARVPNYPFKGDDWYKMSLKQLLKDAVEEG